jgi:hypothetical protein
MAPLGVGFVRECAGKPGLFREALTVEKKLAASLADKAGFEPAVVIPRPVHRWPWKYRLPPIFAMP